MKFVKAPKVPTLFLFKIMYFINIEETIRKSAGNAVFKGALNVKRSLQQQMVLL